jgi:PiT family inorganic phosphate transporter
LAKVGWAGLKFSGFAKIGVSILLSPLLGFFLALLLMTGASLLFLKESPKRVDRWGRSMQLVSASLYSLGHGGNDAQKTMGIIAALLFSTGTLRGEFRIPLWVVLSCHGAMGLGTLMGGWRIVRTLGMRITKLRPIGGCCAETGGAITLFLANALGIPVSTTHTISGAIMGVGAVNKFSAVRWGVAGRIVWAWLLTIPASALVSVLCWWALNQITR